MENLQYKRFADVNLNDPFFDSLKSSYREFSDWFRRKAGEYAYVFYGDLGLIDGFLYLKAEPQVIDDCIPALSTNFPRGWLKVGTLKINAHGTKLGERFIKKIFDYAITYGFNDIYVTVFSEHVSLIALFERYGFWREAEKVTANGTELVLTRRFNLKYDGVENTNKNYPLVNFRGDITYQPQIYLLSLYPKWHTRLLPDSILRNEDTSIVQDVSPTNSIHKVYLTAMSGIDHLKRGDILFIYRTGDNAGPAYYRALVSSVCVVEEYRHIDSFGSYHEFERYCAPYSVFSQEELQRFWQVRKYPHILRFSYNIALPKRIIRKDLLEQVGLSEGEYFGFMPLTHQQAYHILRLGQVNESFVIY
ncbi:hypothetical protein [Neisseria cinerea]|mgnify:FL=1|uniref:hypothetical protein n=1 Tax=Neisseria cinerea TaxID=483 RepID=UPI002B1D99E0|nr:hypothetical protein [Neisseria cinerea]